MSGWHDPDHPILLAARGRLCTLRTPLCNNDRDSVVACHVYVGPKGTGGKGLAFHVVFACSCCHDVLDRRVRCVEWELVRDAETLRALVETQTLLWELSLLLTVRELKAPVPERIPKILPRRI